VGTPVFGGMLAAAIFGIFVIPMLYVVFQRMREWTAGRTQDAASRDASAAVKPGSPRTK
jgi:HAE1 family hydrophobic/amphiphilic exporter-1